ncbi:unnamed protein product [Closterium sp. NIES-53]
MASLRVLAFDHEGRPVAFDMWHDDLQVYLLSDIKDSVSLFDHVSGVAPAPPTTAHGGTRSQWLSRDATSRLAIRNHLPVAACTHFGQHRTAPALYDAVVARYSSPATAALGRLLLPYLFLELSTFATVADQVTHLRTSDARYRATVPAEDHFLSLDPTSLTVDLLEQHLLAAETSANAVGAARGTLRPPFFEGCSPSPLSPSFASAAAADVSVTEDVGAALTSAKRRSSKGKGGRGGGCGSGGGGGGSGNGGGGSGGGGGGSGGGGGGGTGGGSGGSYGGGGSGGSGSSGGGGTGGGRSGPRRGGPGGVWVSGGIRVSVGVWVSGGIRVSVGVWVSGGIRVSVGVWVSGGICVSVGVWVSGGMCVTVGVWVSGGMCVTVGVWVSGGIFVTVGVWVSDGAGVELLSVVISCLWELLVWE